MNTWIIADEAVMNKIYCIRDQKIMLDRDLAIFYGVQPIRLREQVKRNQQRFPVNFMFRLTEQEADDMVSQKAIASKKQLGGFLPYAFTEHGILMLAAVLRSDKAMQASIRLIEIFVKMRQTLSAHKDLLLQLQQTEKKINEHDNDIQQILACLEQWQRQEPVVRYRIGFRRKDEAD